SQIKASSKARAKAVDAALKHLEQLGIIEQSAALSPPTVRARYSQTARLAIPPQAIHGVARHLGRDSRRARLLEVIAASGDEGLPVQKALKLAEVNRQVLTTLVNSGAVEIIEGWARLALPPEAVDEVLIDLREGYKQLRALELLAEHGTMSIDALREQSGIKSADVKKLAEDGLIEVYESPIFHDVLANRDFIPKMPPMLTPAQKEAWQPIEAQIKAWQWGKAQGHTFLLHGVTGSGKTEIYLKAIEQTLAQGRDALFLVPEIALTPQTIRRVAERFPGQVAVIHGSLKPRERYDTWQRIRRGLVKIVVGARSAIFAPLADIGLIILDEEHDHSYKQTPPISPPYYHTREIAEYLAKLQKA
ncbi:MAG: DEAD/DEAH box helicase, partial [Chloroflexi bacterium]